MQDDSSPERREMLDRARSALHAEHRGLSAQQVELIANVVVELRLAQVRLRGPEVTTLYAHVRRSA